MKNLTRLDIYIRIAWVILGLSFGLSIYCTGNSPLTVITFLAWALCSVFLSIEDESENEL